MARYTAVQLAREVGVSLRTLSYYVAKGVLPPAEHRGPLTLYDEAYRLRLKAIVRLRKTERLRLPAIAKRLDGASEAEIASLAGQGARQAKRQTAAPTTAAKSGKPALGSIERWEHICLHPGLELHLAADADETAQRMAQAIRAMFGPV